MGSSIMINKSTPTTSLEQTQSYEIEIGNFRIDGITGRDQDRFLMARVSIIGEV